MRLPFAALLVWAACSSALRAQEVPTERFNNEVALAYSPVSPADVFFYYMAKIGPMIYPDYEQYVTGALTA